MKKIQLSLLTLMMGLSLVACSKPEPMPDPIDVDKPDIEEVETVAYTNPLTGEFTEEDISKNRPVFVMMNTIYEALPQSNNSKADVFIEITEEGGITRVATLYQDISQIGKIGSIRSCREYFLAMGMSFDAIISHAGGDKLVLEYMWSNYPSIDSLQASAPYYRDENRLQYLAYEHTMYSTGERLQNYIDSSGIRKTHESDYQQVFKFADDATPDGKDATYVDAQLSGYKSTQFNYDEASKKYKVSFWNGEKYYDEANDCQVEVTNIIILRTSQWTKEVSGDKPRQAYDLSSGSGYYISNGKCCDIQFEKGNYNNTGNYGAPLKLMNEDGSPLEMNVGKTYIIVMDQNRSLTIE